MVTGENGERYLLTNAHSVEYWSQASLGCWLLGSFQCYLLTNAHSVAFSGGA